MPFLKILGTLFINLAQPIEMPIQSSQIWISKQDTLSAHVAGSKVILKGLKSGSVWVSGIGGTKNLQRVQVLGEPSFRALEKCGAKDLQINAEALFVKEEALNKTQLEALDRCGFEGLALAPANQNKILPWILELEGQLNKSGIRIYEAKWTNQGHRHLVLGVHNLDRDVPKAKAILGALRIFYTFETKTRAKPGKTINFESTLFEYSSHKARQLGLSFPENIPLWSLESGSQLKGAGSESSFAFDFGERDGVGKVLARPKIRTQPGQKAIFQSGGELPVKSHNLHSTQTVWKPYGLQIEILPDAATEIGAQEVSLSFRIEISEPDFSTLIEGMPAMKLRKLENRFDLRVNETSILSSLIQLRKAKGSKGIAGLKDFPIFGDLLSNHTQIDTETELYIALHPSWDEIPLP